MTKAIKETAKRLHTHTVVFREEEQIECASMAMFGQTTKSIAHALGISESKAQYRIAKAQGVLGIRFREQFRNGRSEFAKFVMKAGRSLARKKIASDIVPRFAPYEER